MDTRVTSSGLHKWSKLCTPSKVTIFRYSIVNLHKNSMRDGDIVRPHWDEAIGISRIKLSCKFTILLGCSRQKVTLHHTFHTHMHKYPEIIRLSRIQCTDTICILRKYGENIHNVEPGSFKWISWWSDHSDFIVIWRWFLLDLPCLGKPTVQILIFTSVLNSRKMRF